MFNLQGLDHIAIIVSDMERSINWYQNVLGMERRYAEVWGAAPAMMMVGSSGIALFPAEPSADNNALWMGHIAFRATRAEFEKAQQGLRERGIDYEFKDHTVSLSIYFYDPDKYEIEITTYEV